METLFAFARHNSNANENAKFCMAHVEEWLLKGDFEIAKMWALKSLAYSVSVYHPIYQKFSK